MVFSAASVAEQLKALNDDFASRYGSGDMKFLAQLYTEDSKIMPPGSDVVTGRTG